MADKEPEPSPKNKPPDIIGEPGRGRMVTRTQFPSVKRIPVPPGTKARAHLTRWPGDEEVSPWPSRLALAGTALGFLTAGLLIGRFLLP